MPVCRSELVVGGFRKHKKHSCLSLSPCSSLYLSLNMYIVIYFTSYIHISSLFYRSISVLFFLYVFVVLFCFLFSFIFSSSSC